VGALPEWKRGAVSGLNATLIDRWIEEFSPEEVDFVNHEISSFVAQFGYG
jgi:hypothetical protein